MVVLFTYLSTEDIDQTFQTHTDAQNRDLSHSPSNHIPTNPTIGAWMSGAGADDYSIKVSIVVHCLLSALFALTSKVLW